MSSGEILLFGDINIDTVWPVSEFPTPGRDAYAKSVSVGIGGAVVNTAIVLDKLGQRTGLLACVGKDIWAEKAAETLNATKINQAYIKSKTGLHHRPHFSDRHTGWRKDHVFLPGGERSV